MVAIVGGSRLGLSLGSFSTLGQRGVLGSATQGRSGERAYVNAATGDLVLQTLDAALAGVGPDTSVLRTYNSHGGWGYNIDDGNGWQAAPRKYVRNLGTNLLRRYDHDGATLDYLWDDARQLYVATATLGSAVDTIRVNADKTYTWTDGATGATETYEGGGWSHIIASTDTSGNTIRYTYDNRGLLTQVTMADGETVEYTYGGIGKQDLLQVTTRLASGQLLRQVSYTYDNHSRMDSVTVNLDPAGEVPADRLAALTYTTRYTYDGNTNRVATISQSDGTSLAFTYVRTADNVYRVATVTDGEGQLTRFDYDIVARTTTVTDPLGVSTVFQYGTDGELTQIRSGVTASNPAGLSQVDYAYDALGNLTRMTDGLGNTVVLEYDAQGNLTRQVDAEGNTLVRTYDARNQVLTDTVYAAPGRGATGPSQPQTTRYVYEADGNNLLRFVVSAEGRVTEHRYDARGQRVGTIQYSAASFPAGQLADTAVPSEAEMEAWVGGQDLTRSERSDMAYDFRGQLQTVTTYGSVDAGGSLAVTSFDAHGHARQVTDANGVSHFMSYDAAGRVAKQWQGVTSDDGFAAGAFVHTLFTVFQYDALGRQTAIVTPGSTSVLRDADGVPDADLSDDAIEFVSQQLAGTITTSMAYNAFGEMVSRGTAPTGVQPQDVETFEYDVAGRLWRTNSGDGVVKITLYDLMGNQTALVTSDGALQTMLGRHSDAVGSLSRALKSSMDLSGVYRNLTISYSALGRYDEAMKAADEAVHLGPDMFVDAAFVYAASRAFAAGGQIEAAVNALNLIATKRPELRNDPEFWEAANFVKAKKAAAKR